MSLPRLAGYGDTREIMRSNAIQYEGLTANDILCDVGGRNQSVTRLVQRSSESWVGDLSFALEAPVVYSEEVFQSVYDRSLEGITYLDRSDRKPDRYSVSCVATPIKVEERDSFLLDYALLKDGMAGVESGVWPEYFTPRICFEYGINLGRVTTLDNTSILNQFGDLYPVAKERDYHDEEKTEFSNAIVNLLKSYHQEISTRLDDIIDFVFEEFNGCLSRFNNFLMHFHARLNNRSRVVNKEVQRMCGVEESEVVGITNFGAIVWLIEEHSPHRFSLLKRLILAIFNNINEARAQLCETIEKRKFFQNIKSRKRSIPRLMILERELISEIWSQTRRMMAIQIACKRQSLLSLCALLLCMPCTRSFNLHGQMTIAGWLNMPSTAPNLSFGHL